MKTKKALSLLCSLFPTLLPLSASQIAIQVSPEEHLLLEVSPEDSFLSVMESINYHMSLSAIERGEDAEINNPFHLHVDFQDTEFFAKASKSSHAPKMGPRNYNVSLTQSEKDDISFILRTLANNSLVKIASMKGTIKKVGGRIDRLHPFRFLSHIFTTEELKVCIRNIQGKSWVWTDFLGGIIGSLKEEYKLGNLKQGFVVDFANQIKIDPNRILSHIEQQRWHEFINVLIDSVPREGNPNRYDI